MGGGSAEERFSGFEDEEATTAPEGEREGRMRDPYSGVERKKRCP